MQFQCPSWPPDWPEIEIALQKILRSGDWGRYHAQICRDLQDRLQGILGAVQARLCCSGTAALEIALRTAQVAPGDDVVLAGYDFPGNFRTVELLGARPTLLDVASDSLSLDPDQLAELSGRPEGKSVRAVIVSHLYGRAADIDRIRAICDASDWILIEDACQAVGMQIDGRMVGSFGHLATLSFGGSKPVSAGGGGCVLANTSRLAARLGSLLDRPGEVFPLSPLQAAVIGPQLDRLEQLNQTRLATATFVQDQLQSELTDWTWLSGIRPDVFPVFYKIAWLAASQDQRGRVLEVAERLSLPMGAGFRPLSSSSPRRCGKPVPTPRSDLLGQRLFVLDHRALLLPPSRHHELGAALRSLFRAVKED